MSIDAQAQDKISVIYDKECPLCNHFVCAINDANEHVETINGREKSNLLDEAIQRGLNIDNGSIVFYQGKYYYGYEALYLIARKTDAAGVIGFLNRYVFRFKFVARVSYPSLVILRKILLFILGKPLIKSAHKPSRITVYYNSACPVCDAGIDYQRGRVEGCDVEWTDVHLNDKSWQSLGSDLAFIRKRLHVKTDSGDIKIGIDAFIVLWEISPRDKWKVRLFKLPVIHGVSVVGYNTFAWVLYLINRLLRRW